MGNGKKFKTPGQCPKSSTKHRSGAAIKTMAVKPARGGAFNQRASATCQRGRSPKHRFLANGAPGSSACGCPQERVPSSSFGAERKMRFPSKHRRPLSDLMNFPRAPDFIPG